MDDIALLITQVLDPPAQMSHKVSLAVKWSGGGGGLADKLSLRVACS